MRVFISTGGLKLPLVDTIKKYIDFGFQNIEVSGGVYCKNWENLFVEMQEKTGALLQLHNYYASNQTPFVLNLASEDDEVISHSMTHCKRSIDMTAKLGSGYYAFHAGFLIDPKVKELGNKIVKRKIYDRQSGLNRFVKNCYELYEYARNKQVKLLIENNVLSLMNLKEFGLNPLLMVDPDEIEKVFNELPCEINLLFDVAHAKVSATSLGIDPCLYIKKLSHKIKALHVSDNDGFSDSNDIFFKDSWFVEHLTNLNLAFCTVEVYSEDVALLKSQISLIEKMVENVK